VQRSTPSFPLIPPENQESRVHFENVLGFVSEDS
jgi:hypothetical protein